MVCRAIFFGKLFKCFKKDLIMSLKSLSISEGWLDE